MLIQYLISCFNRYLAGARYINRLLHYLNRHYVEPAVGAGKGWLRSDNVLHHGAPPKDMKEWAMLGNTEMNRMERGLAELRAWGYDDGGSAELMSEAESCAESASANDQVVPVCSLALRRFRTEFLDPLLSAPEPLTQGGETKGRLPRAVKELLERTPGGEEEKGRIAAELAGMMKSVGVRGNQYLRERLEGYVIATASI